MTNLSASEETVTWYRPTAECEAEFREWLAANLRQPEFADRWFDAAMNEIDFSEDNAIYEIGRFHSASGNPVTFNFTRAGLEPVTE